MKENIYYQISKIEQNSFSDPWSVAMIEDSQKYDYNFIIVLADDINVIVGGSDTQLEDACVKGYLIGNIVAGESELLRIAVADDCRGKGYSKKIMNAYLGYVAETCDTCFLEVRSQNDVAINLYEKYGYVKAGERKNYYTNPQDNAIIYNKNDLKDSISKEVTYVVCNKCGRNITLNSGIAKEDYISVEKNWGYFSSKDGETHKFVLCEKCYDEIVDGLLIKPSVKNTIELL